MTYLIGIVAAVISFCLNRALFRRIGYRTIIAYSPILEEVTKTLPAYYFGADILAVHLVFGVIEGGYECWQSKARGILPAFLSVVGHFLFGLSAATVLMLAGSIALALVAGIVLHLLWNAVVVKFF